MDRSKERPCLTVNPPPQFVRHMSDVLVRAAKRCLRRVLKAEWCEAHDYFVATLECGHVMHGPEEFLKSPLFCLICMRDKTFVTHVTTDL